MLFKAEKRQNNVYGSNNYGQMRVNSYSGGQNNFYGNNNYGSQDINSYGKRSKFFNLYF